MRGSDRKPIATIEAGECWGEAMPEDVQGNMKLDVLLVVVAQTLFRTTSTSSLSTVLSELQRNFAQGLEREKNPLPLND